MPGTALSRVRLSSRIEVGPSSSSKTKSRIGKQPAPHNEGGAVVSDDASATSASSRVDVPVAWLNQQRRKAPR
jgi:hypothetical protein